MPTFAKAISAARADADAEDIYVPPPNFRAPLWTGRWVTIDANLEVRPVAGGEAGDYSSGLEFSQGGGEGSIRWSEATSPNLDAAVAAAKKLDWSQLESDQAVSDFAARVEAAIAEPAMRFELQDQLADTTFRFATSTEATDRAENQGATSFQYLDRWAGVMQVKKRDGGWFVHDVHGRREDKVLASVQEALDREIAREIEARAERRTQLGLVEDRTLDAKMARADARAFRGIENNAWREEAALAMAMNVGSSPAYAAALDKAISAQILELKTQHDQRAVEKQKRKAAQFNFMEDDARSRATRWPSAEASDRARVDADELQSERDATARHYKLDDIALRSDVNVAYRQLLEKEFPDIALEAAAQRDLRKKQNVALQARLATAGASIREFAGDELVQIGERMPVWSGEWDVRDSEHEARPIVMQLGNLYFGGIESRHVHGDVQLAYGEKSSPDLSSAVDHAWEYLREHFDPSAPGLTTVAPPRDALDRDLVADSVLAKEPHALSSVRLRLEATGRGHLSSMVAFIASNSGAIPEHHFEDFVSVLSGAKTGAYAQGVIEEYDKHFGPRLDAFHARWGGAARPGLLAVDQDPTHGDGAPRTASQDAAAALASAERDLTARRQGGVREKQAAELARADVHLFGLVDGADATSRSVALSAIGSMATRHSAYARALRTVDSDLAEAADSEWGVQRDIHGTKVPPTLVLASQHGDRLAVGRRADGAMGWILEREGRLGQVESFYGEHATERMLWRRFEDPELDSSELTAISHLRRAHDLDGEDLHRDGSPWHTEMEVAVIRGQAVRAKAAVLPDGTIGMRLSSSHLEEPRMTLCESVASLETEMTALELDGSAKADVRTLAALYALPNYGPHDGLAGDRVPMPASPWEVFDYQPDSLMRANFEGRTVEVLHEGVITSLHGRAGIEAWTETHDVSDRDRERLVDLDVAAARGVEAVVPTISSSTEKEHSMSTPTASKQDQVPQDPIERIGEKMVKQDWQEAINVVKARDGKGSLYLPKAGGEYGGSLFMVTETHLVQKIARGTLIAHDMNAIENGRAIGSDFDAGKLRLGQPMRIEYGEKIGQAEFLTIGQARRLEVRKEMMEWAEKALPNPKARAAFQKHVDAFTKEAADLPDRPQRNQAPQPRAQNLERGR